MPIAQHVKYPLVPVRFALTRHASCMLHATDQVGYPHHHASLARIGGPHIHTPHTTAPALGGHEGETPQPSSPHRLARQAPLAHPLPAPSSAHVAMGVGLPCMHGDVARTHGLYVAVVAVMAVWRGAAVLHCSSCWRGRTVRYVPAVTSQPLRPSRYVPAGTREHPMRAPLPWRGARMQAHQCMHAHFCTSHLYTFVCLMSPLA